MSYNLRNLLYVILRGVDLLIAQHKLSMGLITGKQLDGLVQGCEFEHTRGCFQIKAVVGRMISGIHLFTL